MTAVVAALFVSPKGPYWTDPLCDCWSEDRDARLYRGPLPVVAHPPCQLWTNMAGVNFVRWGGAHNRPGNDGGCFASALTSVRRYGGVLEHPAGSHAWSTFGLLAPRFEVIGWQRRQGVLGEWACEVCQSVYGCKAQKRTWLLYVGKNAPPELNWTRRAGTHQVGFFDCKKPTLRGDAASRTPAAFANALIILARDCGGAP